MFNGLHRNLRLPTLLVAAILVSVIALAACTSSDDGNTTTESSGAVAADSPSEVSTAATEEQLTVGISMYLLVDDLDDPDPEVSSQRTEEELKVILAGMNEIWSQANIHLELATVDTIVVDPGILRQVAQGDIRAFLGRLCESIPFDVSGPESSLISGFYAKEIGGPNGITPLGTGWYMVIDEPSVFDRRVSSHEVGHILGLRHTLDDRERLLYPGTNGMNLNSGEITVTRYVAIELLKNQR